MRKPTLLVLGVCSVSHTSRINSVCMTRTSLNLLRPTQEEVHVIGVSSSVRSAL